MPRQLMHSTLSPFTCIGIILPVCQSFCILQAHQTALHTRFTHRTSRFKALNKSGLSQPDVFPTVSVWTDRKISITVRVFFFPKCAFWVSCVMRVIGCSRSLKYFLYRTRISSSLLCHTPFCSLMDLATLDLQAYRRVMAYQKTFWLSGTYNPVYARNSPKIALGILTTKAADFRTSAYHDCKEDVSGSAPKLCVLCVCSEGVFDLLVPLRRVIFFASIRDNESFPST